jgi:hypothetical protein
MMSTTNGKSHGNNYILPVVGWIFVMIWYIMDVKNKTIFFSIVLISMRDDLIWSQTVRY